METRICRGLNSECKACVCIPNCQVPKDFLAYFTEGIAMQYSKVSYINELTDQPSPVDDQATGKSYYGIANLLSM